MPVHTFHAYAMEKMRVEHEAQVSELSQMAIEWQEKAEQAGNGKGAGKGKDKEKGKSKHAQSGWGNKAMALVIAVFNRNWEQVTQMAKEYASVPWMRGAIEQKTGWDLDLMFRDEAPSESSCAWTLPSIPAADECGADETWDNPWGDDSGA